MKIFATIIMLLFVVSCVKDELPTPIDEDPIEPGALTLIHYWHFNGVSGTVVEIDADFSAIGGAKISYPGEGEGYMDSRTHRAADPVSNLNLRMGEPADQGAVLRARNPAEGRVLLIEAPSTGYSDLIVTYAITRSRPEVGLQQFYYSPDGGTSWVSVGDIYDAPDVPEYDLVTYDLSEFEEVNDNANLQFKIEYSGEHISSADGNNRYDNLTVDGKPLSATVAEKLVISSVNNNENAVVGEEFSVTILTHNADGLPTPVENNTEVTLALNSGSGTLGGTLTGTVLAGEFSLTISGVTYDIAEEDITIKATAEGLTEAISEPFTVIALYELTLISDPEEAGTLSGEGIYEEGDEITLTAVANTGYDFVSWTHGEDVVSTEAEFTYTMPGEDVALTANFEESAVIKELLHYWHFNDLPEEDIIYPDVVASDYTADGVDQGVISYLGAYLDGTDGTEINAQMEEQAGTALRIRSEYDDLIFEVPSTGFQGLEVRMALTRSGSGADTAEFFYSTDQGTTWVSVTIFTDVDSSEWKLYSADLSDITELDNNGTLMFKIFPSGAEGGNLRMDNFTIFGEKL